MCVTTSSRPTIIIIDRFCLVIVSIPRKWVSLSGTSRTGSYSLKPSLRTIVRSQ